FGGWINETLSWRAVFLINLPIAVIAGLLAWTSIPENCLETRTSHFDIPGSMLAALGLATFILGLSHERVGWAIVGACILFAFCLYESRTPRPILPMSVFKNRSFARVNLMTVFLYGALGMAFFYLPTHLIRVNGYTATQAGAAMAPFGLLMALLSR